MKKMFALVDANSFYASCERIFNPYLKGKPIVVLSNNDGCVVARSKEAKQIGVAMCTPYFKVKKEFGDKVIAQSSNYMLYGEISRRFHKLLSDYTLHQEVYSIDESFLDFTDVDDALSTSREIHFRCQRDLGLPVCVGVGNTKTRAKLANHLAKKEKYFDGVCNLEDIPVDKCKEIFSKYDVGDLWGVGYGNAVILNQLGIYSLLDLYNADPIEIRKNSSVVLEKTVRELRGESCLEIEEVRPSKKQVMTSRSFGEMTKDINILSEAVTHFATRGGEKLRSQGLRAGTVSVFIKSNKYRDDLHQYGNSYLVTLPVPTDDTVTIIKAALFALKKIYIPDIYYKKAGVRLGSIESGSFEKLNLFGDGVSGKSKKLMKTLDDINKKFGKGTTLFASEGFSKSWAMKSDKRSPLYLHDWKDVPVCY